VVRVADAPCVLLVESSAEPALERALLFSAPERLIACRAPGDVPEKLREIEAALRSGAHVAGFLAYEAGYGLLPDGVRLAAPPSVEHALWFGVFGRPRELFGEEVAAWIDERAGNEAVRLSRPEFNRDRDQYRGDFERVQRYLREGESYQVCQSLRARFTLEGSPPALFQRLRRAQRTPYSALIKTAEYSLLSLSPELFFRKRGNEVELKPMKGTAAAGENPDEDERIATRMQSDPKTRAENVMIVDLLRNDVGRLARPGSVRVPKLFEVERFDRVLQMTSTIRAELEPSVGIADLMRALFPSGSVTGAPKLRTMQIIRELEPSARGIFCGSIGFATPDGDACFNVAIRSLSIEPNGASKLGVGSGIVVDSVADAEFEECMLKARFLSALADP